MAKAPAVEQARLIDVAIGGSSKLGAVDSTTLAIYAAILRVRKALEGPECRRGCRVVVVALGSNTRAKAFDSQSFVRAAEVAFRSESRAVAYESGGSTTFIEWCEHPPMEELKSAGAIKKELETLQALVPPPLQKPLHFLRLEHLVAAVQRAENLTHEDRVHFAEAINELLDNYNAALRCPDGLVANRIEARLRGGSSDFRLITASKGARGFIGTDLEVVHAKSNRRNRK